MKIKWKCVWRVLKPKVISVLIIIISALVFMGIIILVGEYLISTAPTPDFTNMSLADQRAVIGGCGCGISPMSMVAPIMIIVGIIGIIILSIELIKSLAEALKPCIIWEDKK
jgi:hypothetical protein